MTDYLISVPVWGLKYCKTFESVAIPSLRAALKDFKPSVQFMIHTDQPDFIKTALNGFDVDVRSIPQASTYVALQNGHADAVRSAEHGQRVVLLNADLAVSKNLFSSCEAHIQAGKRAIVTTGIRTDPQGQEIPVGAAPRALLEWAWIHRHRIIRDLEWGTGCSMLPTNLFFIHDGNVVLRGFHLHPVALLKDVDLPFRSTIDGDLLDYFDRDSIHVVTSPDDLSMLEVSDSEKRFPIRKATCTPHDVAASMASRSSAMHRWLFEYRIGILGNVEDITEDIPVCNEILRHLSRTPTVSFGGRR